MFDFLKRFLGLGKKPVEKKEDVKEDVVFQEDRFVMDTEIVSEKNDGESLDDLTEKYFPKQEAQEPEPKHEIEEQVEEQVDEQVDEQVEEQVEEQVKEQDQGYVTNMPEHNLEDSNELNGQLNSNDQERDRDDTSM